MKSVMQHSFSKVPRANIPRSQFNRSHGYKTTFDGGWLIPFYLDEVLPGDTFNVKASLLGRLATPIAPIMDNLFLDTFYFYVPNRLVWTNWNKFLGAQYEVGSNPPVFETATIPQVAAPNTGYPTGSLQDYLGLPVGITYAWSHNALPTRMYNLIWNEWFRDQNLQDPVVVDTGDSGDDWTDYNLLRRGKRHDYFTSCLPWPQKGDEVTMPIGGMAPIEGIGKLNQSWDATPTAVYETGGTTTTTYAAIRAIDAGGANDTFYVEEDPDNTGYPGIYANLNLVTAPAINALRQAFQIQKMYERDARGGTRVNEVILAHFGVVVPDARLQRPELLSTSSTPIIVNPVVQNSATETGVDTPQGNLAAFGVVGHKDGFVKSFVEHGYIIGLCSVRADLTYQQGLDRHWSRQTRFDFYWPALSHLGEQAVLTQEIYMHPTNDATNDNVWGYQERFAEYRYGISKVTGLFRSNPTTGTSLDIWHLSQELGPTVPVLDDAFISDTPPIDRISAVPSEPHMLLDAYINVKCARPMPVYSVPGLIDHF